MHIKGGENLPRQSPGCLNTFAGVFKHPGEGGFFHAYAYKGGEKTSLAREFTHPREYVREEKLEEKEEEEYRKPYWRGRLNLIYGASQVKNTC